MRISNWIHSLKTGLFLAFRGIRRGNKTIQILTVSMLLLVFLNLVLPRALLRGLINTVNGKLVTLMTSNVTIAPPKSQAVFADVDTIEAAARATDGVDSVTAQQKIAVQISADGNSTTYGTQVVEPAEYTQVFEIQKYMKQGSFLAADDQNKIVLGVQVAGDNNANLDFYATSLRTVQVGDKVTVSFNNGKAAEFTVKGIFDSDFSQGDTRSFISREDYARINPTAAAQTSIINVKLKKGYSEDQVMASFNSLNLGVVVDKWQNQAGVLRSVTKTFDVVIILLQLIALIVGSITIYIVTFVDLNNKRKQIGIQRAIGISSATLVVNYVIRGIVYAVIGNLFGLVAYLFVLVPWERLHPFKFPFGIVFLEVNGSYLVQVFGVLFTIAVISSAIPTWRAIKIKILDAIWGN